MQHQPTGPASESSDIEQNKGMAILAYLLFFVPLLAAKESPYARYHANQGFLLFLVALVANVVLGIIPIIGWLLLPVVNLVIVAFVVLGMVRAASGQKKPLPFIGDFKLIQ
ncbi:DUF4870 domain-containing protein [Paenibacillus flagellatus]|uniref:DUF4870 domain-containing protein n=1 Tax=Paenibacillus flagellatus TaxID=2211139 RepID=A0A2V5K879_9BACL|nr:hypothetical protein [Paenibacillus flagellatus]PYI55705.1 hypothetical protein DLM86_08235 [Paenibacillus flagellatus]